MTRIGFDSGPLKLGEVKPRGKRKPSRDETAEAVRAGHKLGFVPREASTSTMPRTRNRKREKRGNLLIHGPDRVLARFRDYADNTDLSYWEALERLLEQDEQ
ncbi:MAG: hypothetical protein ACR2PM_02975 [Hyphomicrobiales bacterium]